METVADYIRGSTAKAICKPRAAPHRFGITLVARARPAYECTSCGGRSTQWSGQCADCGEWNTLHEAAADIGNPGQSARASLWSGAETSAVVTDASAVAVDEQPRRSTRIGEFDRVLGGGLVAGSVVLIGGDPGIGKSTLLLQVLAGLGGQAVGPSLYVSGEESPAQVVLRGRRLGVSLDGVRLLAETSVERVVQRAREECPGALVIDSIQTMHVEHMNSAPGSVAQVRESGAALVRYAKSSQAAVFLVGHVTKEGALAGPRVLEHMVDTVLYFEAEGNQRYRLLRAVKNRFGAANELGIFAMTEGGLREVANPSAIFLSRHALPVAGSVVTVTREGTRPLLVEIQALVDDGGSTHPRRVTVGLDPNRLSMLLAVINRHSGAVTHGQDVFVNVVGGVRITETGADLPTAAAVLSSLRDQPIPVDTVVFGEVGLAGEIRPVFNGEERLQAAAQHGFKRAVVPKANRLRDLPAEMEVVQVERLGEALDALFRGPHDQAAD